MKTSIKNKAPLNILTFLLLNLLLTPLAFAGNGATIILETGVTFKMRQGYDQISTAMQKFSKKKQSNDQFIEIKIDGSSFTINLGKVAAICRDECQPVQIIIPKDKN